MQEQKKSEPIGGAPHPSLESATGQQLGLPKNVLPVCHDSHLQSIGRFILC